MDVNDFWQENKRFVLTVSGGVLVFFTSVLLIKNIYGAELVDQERRKTKAENTLAGPLYAQAELDALRAENAKLVAAHGSLLQASTFQARPAFAPNSSPMATRYFEVVDATRSELLPAAGRAGIAVPEDIGLPALAPNKDEHIARHLDALDIIDRTLRLAFEAGIGRVEGIDIKLDARLLSGKPLDGLEKTHVTFKLRGNAAALTQLTLMLESSSSARVGVLDSAKFLAGGARVEDARLELVLCAVRMHESKSEDPASPKPRPKPTPSKGN